MILVEPRFSGLAWAKGVCVTEFGPVDMEWKLSPAGTPEISCTIPAQAQARLRLRELGDHSVLSINGKAVPIRNASGRIETPLQPGTNVIHFMKPR